MAIKVPTPALQGPAELGSVQPTARLAPSINLSYLTPPVKDVSTGVAFQGRTMAAMGQGIMNFANTAQQHYDQAMLLKAEQDWWDLEKRLNDPNDGIWSKYGMNAFGTAEAMQGIVKEFKASVGYGGMSLAGRRAMDKMLGQYDRRAVTAAQDFERTQVRQAKIDGLNATLKQQVDRATLAPNTDAGNEEFSAAITMITSKLTEIGAEEGWTQEELGRKIQEFTSSAYLGRVAQFADGILADGERDPQEAMTMLEDGLAAGYITAEDYGKMYPVLDEAIVDQAGQADGAIGVQKTYEALHGPLTSSMISGATPTGAPALGTRMNPGTYATSMSTAYTSSFPKFQAWAKANGFGDIIMSSSLRTPQQQANTMLHIISNRGYFDSGTRAMLAGSYNQMVQQYGDPNKAAIEWSRKHEALLRSGRDSGGVGLTQRVAPPGFSYHQSGQAADLKFSDGRALSSLGTARLKELHDGALQFGFYFPLTPGHGKERGTWSDGQYVEDWHMELLGTRGTYAYTGEGVVRGGGQSGITVSNLKMVGLPGGSHDLGVPGVKFYQGGGSNDHLTTDANGKPTSYHSDWSQFVAIYRTTPQPGDIQIGSRNGQPVYRAPDYARDPNTGEYLMVSADQALKIMQNNGWLVPTLDEWKAAAKLAQHYSYNGTDTHPHADHPDQEGERRRFVANIDAQRAGLPEGTMVMFGKEFIADSIPDTQVQAASSEEVQINPGNPSSWRGFPSSLIHTESRGNFQASNNVKDGHFGRGQFNPYWINRAISEGVIPSMTPQQFLKNEAAQVAVENWYADEIIWPMVRHYSYLIGTKIQGVTVTPNGLFAVAHLGGIGDGDPAGKGGLQNFVRTAGGYNPSDGATRLLDYLKYHGEAQSGNMTGGPAYSAAGRTPGMDPGAAHVWNMPQGTDRERRIRNSAMDYYLENMRFMDAAQNRNTAALLDDVYTRIVQAGQGSSLYDIVSTSEIQMLGTDIASVMEFHEKVSTGAGVEPDHDAFFAWRELAMDDTAAFIAAYQDKDNRAWMRNNFSDEQLREIDDLYGRAREMQAEAASGQGTAGAGAGDLMDKATYTLTQAHTFASKRLAGYPDLKPAQVTQLAGQIANAMFNEAQARATELRAAGKPVDITSETAMAEAYDRASRGIGLQGEDPMSYASLMQPVDPNNPSVTKVDLMFENDTDALIDALVTGEASGILGPSGPSRLYREDLERIEINYASDHGGRYPTPSQLLQAIVYAFYEDMGDTAYAPVGFAGNTAPEPARRYRVPGTSQEADPTRSLLAPTTPDGGAPMTGLGAGPNPEPWMIEQQRPSPGFEGPMPAMGN